MTKQEYLDALAQGLSRLPKEEARKSMAYFREMIEDRVEDGMDEEAAVAAIEAPEAAAERILYETPLKVLAQSRFSERRRVPWWMIVLLIIGSPLWISLLAAFLSAALAVYASIWAVIVSVAASIGAIGLTGILLLPYSAYLFSINGVGALAVLGGGLVLTGACILLLAPCWKLVSGITKGTVYGLKRVFIGKKGAI